MSALAGPLKSRTGAGSRGGGNSNGKYVARRGGLAREGDRRDGAATSASARGGARTAPPLSTNSLPAQSKHGKQGRSPEQVKSAMLASRKNADRAKDEPWRNAATENSATYKQRMSDLYQTLKEDRERERRQAIRDGFLADPDKPTSLAHAITPVGTCQDMCPEFERVERIVQMMVDGSEKETSLAGTRVPCEALMVKRFRRSAAGYDEQLPSDIRPPTVLKSTLDYLINDIVGGTEPLSTVHKFVWDRTRGIRNDFSIQQVTKTDDLKVAIDCFERIARFHILSLHQLSQSKLKDNEFDHHQEREQLNNTLLSLMYYYDDSRKQLTSPNEAEFRAYCVIFEIQDQRPDLQDRAQSWPRQILKDARIQTAFRLYAAATNTSDEQGPLRPRTPFSIAQACPGAFWSVVQSNAVSYLSACVAEVYFNAIRTTALEAIWQTYKGNRAGAAKLEDWILEDLRSALGFDDDDETAQFCEDHGFMISETNAGDLYVDLGSVSGGQLRDSNPRRTQIFSRSLVEHKRLGRTLPAIMNGLSASQSQALGYIEDSSDTEFNNDNGDQDLFINGDSEDERKARATPSTLPAAEVGNKTNPFAFHPKAASFQPVTGFGQPSGQSTSLFGQPSIQSNVSQSKPSSQATTATNPFAFSNGAKTNPFAFNANAKGSEVNTVAAEVPNPGPNPETREQTASTGFNFLAPQTVQSQGAAESSGTLNINHNTSPLGQTQAPAGEKPTITWPPTGSMNPIGTSSFKTQPTPSKSPFQSLTGFSDASSTKKDGLTTKPIVPSPLKNSVVQNITANVLADPKTGQSASTSESKSPFSAGFIPVPASNPAQNASSKGASLLPPPQPPRFSITPSSSPQDSSSAVKNDTSASNSLPQDDPGNGAFRAKIAAKATAAKPDLRTPAISRIASILMTEDQGFLQQFVEFSIEPILRSALIQFEDEKSWSKAKYYRTLLLSKKYFLKWHSNAWNLGLRRRARERRRKLARSVQDIATHSTRTDDEWSNSPFASMFSMEESADKSLTMPPQAISSVHKRQSLPNGSSTEHGSTKVIAGKRKRDAIDDRSGQHTPARARSSHKRSSTVDNPSMSAPPHRSLKRSLHTSGNSEGISNGSLHDDVLMQQVRRAAPNIKSDTTRTDYFKLKSMGVDPDTPAVPETIRRPKLRIQDGIEDDNSQAGLFATSMIPRIDPEIQPAQLNLGNDDDEALFESIRALRETLADSTSWFQQERQTLECEVESSTGASPPAQVESPAQKRLRDIRERGHMASRGAARLKAMGDTAPLPKGFWNRIHPSSGLDNCPPNRAGEIQTPSPSPSTDTKSQSQSQSKGFAALATKGNHHARYNINQPGASPDDAIEL